MSECFVPPIEMLNQNLRKLTKRSIWLEMNCIILTFLSPIHERINKPNSFLATSIWQSFSLSVHLTGWMAHVPVSSRPFQKAYRIYESIFALIVTKLKEIKFLFYVSELSNRTSFTSCFLLSWWSWLIVHMYLKVLS